MKIKKANKDDTNIEKEEDLLFMVKGEGGIYLCLTEEELIEYEKSLNDKKIIGSKTSIDNNDK